MFESLKNLGGRKKSGHESKASPASGVEKRNVEPMFVNILPNAKLFLKVAKEAKESGDLERAEELARLALQEIEQLNNPHRTYAKEFKTPETETLRDEIRSFQLEVRNLKREIAMKNYLGSFENDN